MYTGNEHLLLNDSELPFSMLDFWQWAYSDIVDNTERGVFAEYIVKAALSLNAPDVNQGNRWWHPYDLTGPSGLRLEIKSSAYIQGREQADFSKISFSIAPTKLYNEYTDYSQEAKRHSDVFVFCIWNTKDRSSSPLNMDLWDFYVLPTIVLDKEKPDQKNITLSSLLALQPKKCNFSELRKTISLEYAKRGPFTFSYNPDDSSTPPTEFFRKFRTVTSYAGLFTGLHILLHFFIHIKNGPV